MPEHYKRTFVRTQLLICGVTLLLMRRTPAWVAVFAFLTMQVGALLGEMWAARLKGRT